MLGTTEQKQIADILREEPVKIVLSNRSDKSYIYRKKVIQKIQLKGHVAYQIESFTDKQAFHENIEEKQLSEEVFSVFPEVYSQMNIFGNGLQWDFKITKKGRLLSNVHKQPGRLQEKDGKEKQGTV